MNRKKLLLILLVLLMLALTACAVRTEDVGETEYYRVTFYADHSGEETLTFKRIQSGGTIRLVPQRNRILGWTDSEGNFVNPEGMTVTEDMDFYAWTLPELADGHVEYMGKIVSKWFRPDSTLRREEAAQILYSLLQWPEDDTVTLQLDTGETLETEADTSELVTVYHATNYEPVFSDLDDDCPYYLAVKTILAWHLMGGYSDGTFRPDQAITRAEFVTMLLPFMEKTGSLEDIVFSDVPADHWAAQTIANACVSGLLKGFEDDSFLPESPITRAEAVMIINRLMGYNTDHESLDNTTPENLYVDISRDHWAYYDILDATYSNKLLPYLRGEISGLEPGFLYIDGGLYHVNEDLKLDFFEAGFHFIDGVLYVIVPVKVPF